MDLSYKSKEQWPKLSVDLDVNSADDPEVKGDLMVVAFVKDFENAT